MEERRPTPIEKLTIAGRLLLVATILLFSGGFCLTFFFIADNYPPGLYPLLVFFLPACLVCFLLFLFVAWLLERCGIQIYADPTPKPPQP